MKANSSEATLLARTNEIETLVKEKLNPLGLFSFGWFQFEESQNSKKPALLIGNRARNGKHEMFEALKLAPEYFDSKSDPLNRWTKRVFSDFCDELAGRAIYPFDEKVWPFQQFAKQVTGMRPSPLGILIHPEFGLWQAFRGVLVFDEEIVIQVPKVIEHPCDDCMEKPCLTACPVNAFSLEGLNVSTCFEHLDSIADPDCMSIGCRAREACPVGISYSEEQLRFHMKAYRGA